jgi:Ribbon-helix-helix protein, copG family
MRRIQLHLDEELDDALAREAARRGQAKAHLIREYLWREIDRHGVVEDSLDELIGLSDAAPVDGETIDDVVYG